MTFRSPESRLGKTSRIRWSHGSFCLLSGLLAGVSACSAHAQQQETFWNKPVGNFFDAANWSPSMPTSQIRGRINNGGVAQITTQQFGAIGYVSLGSEQNTSGTLSILTGGVANFLSIAVGALNATGFMNITGGGSLTSFGGAIGSDYLGVGTTNIDGFGSSWTITGSQMVVGGNGTGTMNLRNGGSMTVQGGLGKIELGNHNLSIATLNIGTGGAPGSLNVSEIYNGSGKATVVFNHNEPFYDFNAKFFGKNSLNGYLNIRHEGTGTTILSAVESNLADTITVASGTLIVNGNIKGSSIETFDDENEIIVIETTIGTTEVEEAGTLGGIGFIEGATTVKGKLAPGMSAGVLKFGGDLSLDSTATVKIELGGQIRGTQYDGVDVAGALLYGGTLEVVFLDGFVPADGLAFDLFNDFASYTGNFANITFSDSGYSGSFNPETGVLTVSTVPEPGVLGLSAIGLAGFAARRRRQAAKNTGNHFSV